MKLTSEFPMAKEYISIHEAAELSKKSVQTIRRAIKARKLKVRRQNTPQGFNYMVRKSSVCEFYGLTLHENAIKEKIEKAISEVQRDEITINRPSAEFAARDEILSIDANDFRAFAKTMETLISQHNEERRSFMRLIDTMQEKIYGLENQLNLLKAPVGKSWYQFWK